MEIDLYRLLADSPLELVFVVLGLGLLVGRIKIKVSPAHHEENIRHVLILFQYMQPMDGARGFIEVRAGGIHLRISARASHGINSCRLK